MTHPHTTIFRIPRRRPPRYWRMALSWLVYGCLMGLSAGLMTIGMDEPTAHAETAQEADDGN